MKPLLTWLDSKEVAWQTPKLKVDVQPVVKDATKRYSMPQLRTEAKKLKIATTGRRAELIVRLQPAGWKP